MKSSVTIALTFDQLSHARANSLITLSREQVEAAHTLLNLPEPLKPGDKVFHVNLDPDKFTFMILDQTADKDSTVVASLTDGNVFHYLTRNLRRIE